MYANNSFYTGLQTFSGLTFGAFEFAWMQSTLMRFDVLIFLALAFCPLAYLAALKSKLVSVGVKTYALSRPYRHIFADFLFYISVTASFSAFVYIYTRNLRFADPDGGVPPYTAILLINFVLFAISMGLYTLLAKEERFAASQGAP